MFRTLSSLFIAVLCLLPVLAVQATEKVLIVVTSHGYLGQNASNHVGETGYFLSEVTHPYYVFKTAGYQIDIASPAGGAPPVDPGSFDLSDDDNKRFVETPADWNIMQNSLPLSEIEPDRYDAIIFAGGHGTMWDFPDNPDIQRLTREIYEQGGVVAAVCHGPAALVNVKRSDGNYLIDGLAMSTFTNLEERIVRLHKDMPFLLETRLKERGATIRKAWLPFMKKVTVDARLITGQNPNSAREMATEIVNVLSAPATL